MPRQACNKSFSHRCEGANRVPVYLEEGCRGRDGGNQLSSWLPALKHQFDTRHLLYGVLELDFVRKMLMAYGYYILDDSWIMLYTLVIVLMDGGNGIMSILTTYPVE
jgi:hypothetical protein